MSADHVLPRLLAGPPLDGRMERFHDHLARLGPLPGVEDPAAIVGSLEESGLLGRGGAGFPVGRKWRALAERRDGEAVVVANGAEGEVASWKDRVLMTARPHLVLDGAELAAAAIGATEIVVYVGSEHGSAVTAMRNALIERPPAARRLIRLVTAPISYVAGEASAAVHFINRGDARPTATPPRPSQHGVRGRPTLVQNVESLAYAGLIARFGERWYRSAGRHGTPGTALVTITGAVEHAGVSEVELGTTIAEVAAAAGADASGIRAVLLGGYFGTWARADDAWELALDPAAMRAAGFSFGCGSIVFLPHAVCGVSASSDVIGWMAGQSAGQCGPCVFGLRAIAQATERIASGAAGSSDLADIERWTSHVVGRGACHHPDGAAQLMVSALDVFGDEFAHHVRTGRCSVDRRRVDVA